MVLKASGANYQNRLCIVGEPTLTDIAIAEKGLLVLDCYSERKKQDMLRVRKA